MVELMGETSVIGKNAQADIRQKTWSLRKRKRSPMLRSKSLKSENNQQQH